MWFNEPHKKDLRMEEFKFYVAAERKKSPKIEGNFFCHTLKSSKNQKHFWL